MVFFWKKNICNEVRVSVENFSCIFKCKVCKFNHAEILNDMEHVMNRFVQKTGIIYTQGSWMISYEGGVISITQSRRRLDDWKIREPFNEKFVKLVYISMLGKYKQGNPEGSREILGCPENCLSCERTNFLYSSVTANDHCAICFEDFNHCVVKILKCGHFFHRRCAYQTFRPKYGKIKNFNGDIIGYRQLDHVCPLCREKYRPSVD